MLAFGIPEYRLPKPALQLDIDFILRHGVELRTGTRVDRVGNLLEQGFRAVYLATGAQKSSPLGIDGENLDGVMDALEFLRARGLAHDSSCGRRVAVIGGGNAAVDAARSARRLGAEHVVILYRRTRDEMPAYAEEVDEALREGIELHELVAPKRVQGKNGRVNGIEMIRMKLGDADDKGRRRPIPVEGSEFVVKCDMVLPAIGQVASVEAADGTALSRKGTIVSDAQTLATSREGVFAGGDVVSGGATVIEAIAHGQRAAVAIDRHLGGPGLLPPDVSVSMYRATDEELEHAPTRLEESLVPAGERIADFREVVLGIDRTGACAEAGRCLRCDLERRKS